MLDYSVLMIGAHSEKLVYLAVDCLAACEMAATRNRSPYGLIYIVVKPDGSRMSINDQREYMASAVRR